MADRYWVGGTADWDLTAGTKWATTSGGAGGAAIPTTADNVFFDLLSGVGVVTVPASMNVECLDLNTTGFAGTLTISASGSASIRPSGSVTLGSLTTFSGGGLLRIRGVGSHTFTSNGKSLSWSVTQETGGGTYTAQDAFNFAAFTLTLGTFNSNSQSWTLGNLVSGGTSTRTLILGSSTITVTGAGGCWNIRFSSLTMTANTATVTLTGVASGFDVGSSSNGGNYNGMSLVQSGSGLCAIGATGGPAQTFANFTRTGTAVKTDGLSIGNVSVTCTGTCTLNANGEPNRLLVQSSVVGTARTITAATLVCTNAVDFMDITGAGAATWTTGASGALYFGDCGGNSGITFTASATQTATGTASFTWSTHGWTSRVPLPQDDVLIPNAFVAGRVITADMPRLGKSISFAGCTGTPQISNTLGCTLFGSMTFVTGVTPTGTSAYTFAGRSTYTLTSAGATFSGALILNAPGGTLTPQDATATNRTASGAITVTNGTLVDNSQSMSLTGAAATFAMTAGTLTATGTWTFSVTSAVTFWNVTGGTVSAASATIILAAPSASTRAFAGFGQTYGTLTYTVADSPGALQFNGTYYLTNLNAGPGRTVSLAVNVSNHISNVSGVAGAPRDYVYLPGVAANYISTPDHADLDITGDIDLIVMVTLPDWTPAATATLISKRATNQAAFDLRIETGGTLNLVLSTNGTTVATNISSSLATGVADGTAKWVRATWRDSDNRVQFFLSDDGASWTQLGTDQSLALAGIFSSTAPVEVGSHSGGASTPLIGKVHRAIVKSGIDGTVVADFDADAHVTGQNTYVDSTGKTWTLNGLAQVGDGRVSLISTTPGTPAMLSAPLVEATGKPVYFFGDARTRDQGYLSLDGTGDMASTPHHSSLHMSTGHEMVVRVRMTDWVPAGSQFIMAKSSGNSIETEYDFYNGTPGNSQLVSRWSSTGGSTTGDVTADGSLVDDTAYWLKASRVTATGVHAVSKADDAAAEPGAWTLVDSDTENVGTGYYNGLAPLAIGARNQSGTPNTPMIGRFYRAIVRDGPGGTTVFDADFTATPPNLAMDYVTIKDVKAIGHANWYAGSHSVDVSGNSYWFWAGALNATLAAPLGGLVATIAATIGGGGATVDATLAAPLGSLAGAVAAVITVPATLSAPLGGLSAAAAATPTVLATLTAPLGALTATMAVTPTVNATFAAPLGVLTVAVSALVTVGASAAAPLGGLAAAMVAVPKVNATLTALLGGLMAAMAATAGAAPVTATLAAVLGSLAAHMIAVAERPTVGRMVSATTAGQHSTVTTAGSLAGATAGATMSSTTEGDG